MTRCAQWRRLPLRPAQEARERAAAECVDSSVQCQLAVHGGGEHHGLLADLEGGTALWLRWVGFDEAAWVDPGDCPVGGPRPGREGFCLFDGHAGKHTWEREEALPS